MELVDRVSNNIYDTFADFDLKKALRLVIIVGGYILIRNFAQRELAKRKLQAHIREDERELSNKQNEHLIDRPEDDASTTQFGWGNRTRRRVKKQEEAFTKMVERAQEQQAQDTNDIADIEDLLED